MLLDVTLLFTLVWSHWEGYKEVFWAEKPVFWTRAWIYKFVPFVLFLQTLYLIPVHRSLKLILKYRFFKIQEKVSRLVVSCPCSAIVEILNNSVICFCLFIYFLTFIFDRQSMSGGGAERGGDTESKAGSSLWAVSTEPDTALETTNCEIMTWAKVRHSTDWATQAPLFFLFKTFYKIFATCSVSIFFHVSSWLIIFLKFKFF